MCQHRIADHIANRKDVRNIGAHMRIGRNEATLIDIHTGIAQAERNRPQQYSGDGDIVASGERDMVMGALAESVANGIGPEVMAQRVLEAIREQRFYILSEEAWRESAHTRLDDIRAGRNPTFAPPVTAPPGAV